MSKKTKNKTSSPRKSGNQKKKILATPPFTLCDENDTPNFNGAFSSVAKLLEGRKNILVLAGAGISVSCGIPDFRSERGIYANLDVEELGLSCPEDLFDWDFFQADPRPFYRFATSLYFPLNNNEKVQPSDSHRFLALLEQQGRLLRVYTQNVDGLEQQAGVSPKKMVYAHGSLQWATCLQCKTKVSVADNVYVETCIRNGTVPKCRQPNKSPPPQRSKRQRRGEEDAADKSDAHFCGGILKPGVTFFGEPLHGNVNRSLEADRKKADALIVIGTSLSVAPMSHVIEYLPDSNPRILINRTIVHPPMAPPPASDDDSESSDEIGVDFRDDFVFDAYLLGFCDDVTRALVKEMTEEKEKSVTQRPKQQQTGRLLACLEEDDELFSIEDWNSTKLPRNRVFLFPGASSASFSFENECYYSDIAHCDGCSQQIDGTIRKCKMCFDYDLCEACFPKLSLQHYSGKHTFSSEAAATLANSD